MSKRILKLRELFSHENIDGLFITNQHNVSYLSGFFGLSPNEREGFFFVTKYHAYLLTFPTYFDMYKDGGDGFESLKITGEKHLSDYIQEICSREHLSHVGFEKDAMTLTELESLQKKLPLTLIPTLHIVETLRVIKDTQEITSIRKAVQKTDGAFRYIQKHIHENVSEKELALKLEFFMKTEADDIAFAPIVAFNQNAAIPHYMPSKDQCLKKNSLILLDFGSKIDGYCSDMTRVVFFGTPKESWVNVYDTVLESQEMAIKHLRLGKTGGDIDAYARNYIKDTHLPVYEHGLGHGVGLAIHESPRIRIGGKETLQDGMVVTIEPGVYIPGECGVRIEDLILLGKDKNEILSNSSKEHIIL